MKRLFAALAVALFAAPLAGVAQDQPLYPVLMDSGNVIIRNGLVTSWVVTE